jgi:hypothetical protein
MTFRKCDNKYLDEKYNYGNKIIKDLLLDKYPNYIMDKSITTISLDDPKYKIYRVHEDSY